MFQSTLPHGERRTKKYYNSQGKGFNPRSRMGSDKDSVVRRKLKRVSIHAPAWGATMKKGPGFRKNQVSIHAPAWGATRLILTIPLTKFRFQSTLPHGERLLIRFSGLSINSCFNPRSRMGSDIEIKPYPMIYVCFNPRSRMGSDIGYLLPINRFQRFQSTLPHGERHVDGVEATYSFQFQSTLPHGERRHSRNLPGRIQ